MLFPAAAADEAFNEICCGVPGVSMNVAGMAATPAGSPVNATAIGPVNPLTPAAWIVKLWEAPPAASVRLAGVAEIEKSGAAVTFRLTDAVFVSVPAVPTNTNLMLPTVAVELAESVTVCGGFPGASAKLDGAADTPAGRPLIVTFTDPEKPLTALAETINCLPAPPA